MTFWKYAAFLIACTALVLCVPAEVLSAIVQPIQKIYWSDFNGGRIQRSNPDGSNVETVVNTQAWSVAIDSINKHLYFGTGSQIRRTNLDGSNNTLLIDQGLNGRYRDIAIDLVGGHLYWMLNDSPFDGLQRSDLDGSNITTLVSTDLAAPQGVGLDRNNGHVYYSDFSNSSGVIRRANLDGSGITDVGANLGAVGPFDLDLANEHIYWARSGSINRIDFDGSNNTFLTTAPSSSQDAALDLLQGHIYWPDASGFIGRVDLDGSNPATLVSGLSFPISIALYVPEPGSGLLAIFGFSAAALAGLRRRR